VQTAHEADSENVANSKRATQDRGHLRLRDVSPDRLLRVVQIRLRDMLTKGTARSVGQRLKFFVAGQRLAVLGIEGHQALDLTDSKNRATAAERT
jgi:hypothetical protein